jgi:regulator of extracellular matrix RemA (YlzA/DUF370 family)
LSDGLLRVGPEGWISKDEIVVIARPSSPPVQRLIESHKQSEKLVDLTGGRPARAVIFTISGYAVLAPQRPETLVRRFLVQEPSQV